jgi:hypothetical protein
MRKLLAGIVGVFTALFLFCFLAPAALAQTNPTSDPVSGTVVIPATLSMSLSANSFTIDPQPGTVANTGTSPYAITASVSTNDGSGYTLSEVLESAFTNSGSATINSVAPYVYSGGPSSTPQPGSNFAGVNPVTIGSSSTVANNDQWGLAWQFNIPGSQAAGSYTGTINVTAIGN